MHFTVATTVNAELTDRCWAVYLRAFDHLRATAVQRHVLTRAEFDEVMADKRVEKHLSWSEELLVGVATFTDDLSSMPLVSPEYFEARWPTEYADRRVFYIGFVGVDPDYHGSGLFVDFVGQLTARVSAVNGVCVLDVCRRNTERFRLPSIITRIARTYDAEVTSSAMDEQTYWAYEFARAS